jgi:hypothetical protein
MVHSPVLPVKKEAGFTYIEFCIVLSALIVFLPALFFVSSTTEKEIKEMIHHSRLEMDYLSFLVWLEKDVQKGVHFRETDGVLYIEQDQQVMIRYMLKDRRLIRSVKKPEDKGFRGTTIVLNHVYYAHFLPDGNGVKSDVGLQNWYAHQEFQTYFSKRSQEADPSR